MLSSFSMLTAIAFIVQLELVFSVLLLIFETFSIAVSVVEVETAGSSWMYSLTDSNRFFILKPEFIVAVDEADGLRFPKTFDILRSLATNPC